jgi:hypothetical protein
MPRLCSDDDRAIFPQLERRAHNLFSIYLETVIRTNDSIIINSNTDLETVIRTNDSDHMTPERNITKSKSQKLEIDITDCILNTPPQSVISFNPQILLNPSNLIGFNALVNKSAGLFSVEI